MASLIQYSAQEYIDLMDRFKAEKIPLSVGVIDMDWHLVEEVDKKDGHGWTGKSCFDIVPLTVETDRAIFFARSHRLHVEQNPFPGP